MPLPTALRVWIRRGAWPSFAQCIHLLHTRERPVCSDTGSAHSTNDMVHTQTPLCSHSLTRRHPLSLAMQQGGTSFISMLRLSRGPPVWTQGSVAAPQRDNAFPSTIAAHDSSPAQCRAVLQLPPPPLQSSLGQTFPASRRGAPDSSSLLLPRGGCSALDALHWTEQSKEIAKGSWKALARNQQARERRG